VNPAAPLPPASQRLGREVPGRALLVPVTGAPEPWVLVVGRVGPGEVFVPADLGPLSIVRTLAESSLARIRAAASLAEVVAREAALLDASSEAVLALDAAGVVRAMSASASDRLGVGRERVVGRRLADVGALAAVAEVVGGDGGRIGAIVLVQGVPFLVRVTGHEGGSILTFTQPTDPAADGGRPARTDEGAEPRVPTWDEMERVTIRQALRHHGGSVARAAKALGVAKGTVYNKMRRYGIDLPTGTSARGGVDDPTGESC
jgi:PAS domain-containing protein